LIFSRQEPLPDTYIPGVRCNTFARVFLTNIVSVIKMQREKIIYSICEIHKMPDESENTNGRPAVIP